MSNDKTSTMVVINGLATTAGSSLHFLAINGNIQPTNFAITIVINKTAEIIKAIFKSISLV